MKKGDGTCYIEVILAAGAESGHASSQQIGVAAFTIFTECVVKYGYGGIANNIGLGGDNNLAVIISSFKPTFKCNDNPAPPWISLVHIIADMYADKKQQMFGPRSAPGVEVPLPYVIKAEWNLKPTQGQKQSSPAMVAPRCRLGTRFGKLSIRSRMLASELNRNWEGLRGSVSLYLISRAKSAKLRWDGLGVGTLKNIRIEIVDESPDLLQLPGQGADVGGSNATLAGRGEKAKARNLVVLAGYGNVKIDDGAG
ncbi:hypothetical protein ACLMJK_007657 [Lecanora helva]